MSDSHKIDRMVAELKAAGWTQVRLNRWRDPNGNLHTGPAGAYRVLKAFQACALVLESALREKAEGN